MSSINDLSCSGRVQLINFTELHGYVRAHWIADLETYTRLMGTANDWMQNDVVPAFNNSAPPLFLGRFLMVDVNAKGLRLVPD